MLYIFCLNNFSMDSKNKSYPLHAVKFRYILIIFSFDFVLYWILIERLC